MIYADLVNTMFGELNSLLRRENVSNQFKDQALMTIIHFLGSHQAVITQNLSAAQVSGIVQQMQQIADTLALDVGRLYSSSNPHTDSISGNRTYLRIYDQSMSLAYKSITYLSYLAEIVQDIYLRINSTQPGQRRIL